ncbi:MAG: DUF4367 domain-containing protein [Clostridiales bacterium]|nr:DUF4367 domain-containing protein [Clostridiales bacterium]
MSNEISDLVFEALFRQAVIDDFIDEISSFPPDDVLAMEYPLSPAFELRMKKLFALDRRKEAAKTIIRYAKKAAVIVFVIISLLFGALMLNPEVRAAVSKVIIEWYEQFTRISFRSEATDTSKKLKLKPSYIPDGYTEYSFVVFNNMTDISYINDAKDKIVFSSRPSDNIPYITVDNEKHDITEISVDGNKAFVIKSRDNKLTNGLIYKYNGYVVEIWGVISVDELLKMAESISIVK